jgi:hypothetical protein
MKKAAIWGLLALFYCLDSWGASYYVRPECTFNGTGVASNCAASGGAAGAWKTMANVNQATPVTGEVVYLCGTFTNTERDNSTTMLVTNFTNSGVIVDGDCSAVITNPSTWVDYNGATHTGALINGEGTLARGFDSGSGGVIGLTIRNVYITGVTDYGIIGQNLASDNWTITDVYCNGSTILTNNCIRSATAGQTGWTINRPVFKDCYVDCIWTINAMTLNDVYADEWSLDNVSGDLIQLADASPCDGFTIDGLYGITSQDIKQGVIINGCSDANPTIKVTDAHFYKRGSPSSLAGSGIVAVLIQDDTASITIRNSSADGYRTGFYTGLGAAMTISGSVVSNFLEYGIHSGTSSGVLNAYNNTVYMSSAGTGIEYASAAAGSSARNNIIANTAVGLNRAATGSDSYNGIYGNSSDACRQGGSNVACGTGTLTSNPMFVGASPSRLTDFRLLPSSAYRRAGADLSIGNYQDQGNRAFAHPPSIGAWEAASGDIAATRTQATARSARQ